MYLIIASATKHAFIRLHNIVTQRLNLRPDDMKKLELQMSSTQSLATFETLRQMLLQQNSIKYFQADVRSGVLFSNALNTFK